MSVCLLNRYTVVSISSVIDSSILLEELILLGEMAEMYMLTLSRSVNVERLKVQRGVSIFFAHTTI